MLSGREYFYEEWLDQLRAVSRRPDSRHRDACAIQQGDPSSRGRGRVSVSLDGLLRTGRRPDVRCRREQAASRSGCTRAVICSHVLQHVRSPESVIQEAWRVLEPGGRAYFTLLDSYPYHGGGVGYGDYHRFKDDAVSLLLGTWSAVHVLRGGGMVRSRGTTAATAEAVGAASLERRRSPRVHQHDPDALRVRDEVRTHRDLSKWVRSAGLGVVLDRSVDAGDWICGRANYFPLSATGAGITSRRTSAPQFPHRARRRG